MNHKIPKRVRLALTRILGDPNLTPSAMSLVTDILVTGVLPPRDRILAGVSLGSFALSRPLHNNAVFRIRMLLTRADDAKYFARPWARKWVRESLELLELYIDAKDL